jgi:hypothetical protein
MSFSVKIRTEIRTFRFHTTHSWSKWNVVVEITSTNTSNKLIPNLNVGELPMVAKMASQLRNGISHEWVNHGRLNCHQQP